MVTKYFLTALLGIVFIFTSHAQTLFTIGKIATSKADFLKAYKRNNGNTRPSRKSYADYLNLYIRYKLKVQAAYDKQLDKSPNQITELRNFRNQIIEPYLNDEQSVNRLAQEAFIRSQKDIHLAHIYIPIGNLADPADTLAAYKKARTVESELKKGKKFGPLAVAYSADPFAAINQGDIGYITVFSLPYALENLAYSIGPGQNSSIFRSRNGYHIFRNLGERTALGRVRVAQIELILPKNADAAMITETRNRADSIRKALISGAKFEELARQFSGDNLSYQIGGEMPEFGIGRYAESFETAAFALTKDGEISEPVATANGFHIIKRLGRRPVSAKPDKETIGILKQMVSADARIEWSRDQMKQHILQLTHFKQNPIAENRIWEFTDSSLKTNKDNKWAGLSRADVLYIFPKRNITIGEWVDYRRLSKNSPDQKGKTNKELMGQFLKSQALEYYRNNLEDYNPDFAEQMNEFKEGNLLFEIMQQEVWSKASSDSAGLFAYYQSHKERYKWEPGFEALVFTCNNEKTAVTLQDDLKDRINDWRRFIDSSGTTVQADSGRFESSQLPGGNKIHLQPGQFTEENKNQTDGSVTFAYILKRYESPAPREFKDARGQAINDYQNYLEDKWISLLKAKYPVKIDEALLATLPL